MAAPTVAPGCVSLADIAAAAGFRRVHHVLLRVGPTSTTATVTGVVHRYPRTVRVPLRLATQLVEAGVPVDVEMVEGAERGLA